MPANWTIVSGISSSDEAKIGGITPDVLTFSGRCERSCCIWPRAVWRLGYWISTRRWARSMKQMNRTRPSASATITKITNGSMRAGAAALEQLREAPCGSWATMPAMMISEMPLPMPRLVICSPSHIRNMVPPTRLMTVVTRNIMPGSITAEPRPAPRPSFRGRRR